MAPNAGSSCTKNTGDAGENLSMGLSNRSSITSSILGASPAAWGTGYSRYYSHSCCLKKQLQEACDSWVTACSTQLMDWGCFLVSLWFILLIFKYRNWPSEILQIWVFGAVLELLTLHFLSVCKQPEGFFYSWSLGYICTAWLGIQGIFFSPPLVLLMGKAQLKLTWINSNCVDAKKGQE